MCDGIIREFPSDFCGGAMNRQQRRRAMIDANLSRDDRRAIAWYRAEARAGRAHCISSAIAPFVNDAMCSVAEVP